MNWHARFLKLGLDTNPIFATRLLNAYVTSHGPNSLTYAHQLFDQVPFKDTTLWTSIISAYTRSGNPQKSLQLFLQMDSQITHQTQPNHFVYATVARACGSTTTDLQLGRTIHARVVKTGFLPNVVVGTSLLDMYAKFRLIECSFNMFDEMPQRNVITWNAMIAAYVLNGMEFDGLELFYLMKCHEFHVPDEFASSTVLAACAGINDLKFGMQVHAYILFVGFEFECACSICNMYSRCGEVSLAERVLRESGDNAFLKLMMIKGYVFNRRYHDAIRLMARDNDFVKILSIDRSIILYVLTACADLSLLRIGRQVHGLIVTLLGSHHNYQSEDNDVVVVIVGALIDMYCKCSSVREARLIFDNFLPTRHISHWNSMITGYIYNGLLEDAIKCFQEMPERNVVSWTAMISGYVQFGLPNKGLRLLAKMYSNEDGFMMQGNCLTFATALDACSCLTMLDVGKQIHAKLIRTIVNADTNNVVVGTALVDMYSKSGNLNYAQIVFGRMAERNVVSWTSMITSYATHGLGSRALEIFQQMMEMGVEPNEVTFVAVLTSCRHCGLVEEGMMYFKLMKDKYGLVPRGDHYSCVTDLLGRAGRLGEAMSLLEEIEDEVVASGDESYGGAMWGALLGACSLQGSVEIGEKVAEKMLEKKQQVPETYIALSNVYAAAEMWDESYKVRERWRNECGGGVGKPGESRIHTLLGTFRF